MEDHQAAVLAHTQTDPDVAVHAEHIAGMEVLRPGKLLRPGPESPILGKVLGHACGRHHIAVLPGLSIQGVVHTPGHIGRAVHTCEVVLVPRLMGIVAMGVIVIVPVSIVLILALEKVLPGLRHADGGGLPR